MNLEKVIFGFFIVLAATLNFGFFIGDIERPELHHIYELAAALVDTAAYYLGLENFSINQVLEVKLME